MAYIGVRENSAKGAIVSNGSVAELHHTGCCLQPRVAIVGIRHGTAGFFRVRDA